MGWRCDRVAAHSRRIDCIVRSVQDQREIQSLRASTTFAMSQRKRFEISSSFIFVLLIFLQILITFVLEPQLVSSSFGSTALDDDLLNDKD